MKWCKMERLIIFKFFLVIILFLLFSWQSYLALEKFLTYSTRISISNLDNGSILYPSISVCKNYLDGLSVGVVENMSIPINKKVNTLHQNFWGKEKLIYFFSHSKMFNITFPCNTLNGATEQGKPCSFPAEDYDGKLQKKCIAGATSNWCFTRTNDNFSIFTTNTGAEFWGYCSPKCNGQVPGPDSEFNLALVDSEMFGRAWSGDLYDLRVYEAGYCVTYDPPNRQPSFFRSYLNSISVFICCFRSEGGISNGLYILMGQKSNVQDTHSKYMMYSFDVYLHDKVNT